MKLDYVASAWVFDSDERILLIHHRKLDYWVPPGGHIEFNETPLEAARRELLEECGIEADLVYPQPPHDQNSFLSVRLQAQPYLMKLELIPGYFADKEYDSIIVEPEHEHLNFVYLFQNPRNVSQLREYEETIMGWYREDELQDIKTTNDTISIVHTALEQMYG